MNGAGSAGLEISRAQASFDRQANGTLLIQLAGTWHLGEALPSPSDLERELTEEPRPRQVAFDTSALGDWDTSALNLLAQLLEVCRREQIPVDRKGLPTGLQRLLALAEAVPVKEDARTEKADLEFLERVGVTTISLQMAIHEMLLFLGEVTLGLGRLIVGRARFRRVDLWLLIQQAGVEALPIVSLVSFLMGTILAFVAAIQLETFGATIYVADLVGVAMARDMGALITAIVMAGRSGAAYAAQLGSMKVTQETDALSTMAISPLEFLVLPRVVALFLMMPLLTLYAVAVGILGGAAVGIGMLGLSFTTYFQEVAQAVGIDDLLGGLFKAAVYGILVALAGCLRGMQSGRSSSAVGDAATSAVVTGIVAIISACGLFSVLFYLLGI